MKSAVCNRLVSKAQNLILHGYWIYLLRVYDWAIFLKKFVLLKRQESPTNGKNFKWWFDHQNGHWSFG